MTRSKRSDRVTPSGQHLPPWLTKRVPLHMDARVRTCLKDLGLGTVCESARCPNLVECYQKGRATFLLMGPRCTRACRFCAVESGPPAPLAPDEPERVARAVERLQLRHAVITSVTRDDLDDGGADHFAATVAAVRARNPETTVELLVPDFAGAEASWRIAAEARSDIFNHNVETVCRLYPRVRPEADYERSLRLLAFVREQYPDTTTKSGLMVGLGETDDEVLEVAVDLRRAGVDMITVGQYLCPNPSTHLPVERFVPPETFRVLEQRIAACGFRVVACAPFVRSSYLAEEACVAAGLTQEST